MNESANNNNDDDNNSDENSNSNWVWLKENNKIKPII